MSLRLEDLARCFDGVYPSLVASSGADGTPNVSYLSHVIRLDGEHVGLSNQFFSKTRRNLEQNPQATTLLVDGASGAQYTLYMRYTGSQQDGEFFERVATLLAASSAQAGMAGVMRLRAVDVFHVEQIVPVPAAVPLWEPVSCGGALLSRAAELTRKLATARDLDSLVDWTLAGACALAGIQQAMLLRVDPARGRLTVFGSTGYLPSGIGAEVALGEGLIGTAAGCDEPLRIADLSRIRRLHRAANPAREEQQRSIALPSAPGSLSVLALPLRGGGQMLGVLYAESSRRAAFDGEVTAALTILATVFGIALAGCEQQAAEAAADNVPEGGVGQGAPVELVHHASDDSIFIDNGYVIKGVAGRLLLYMVECWLDDGRVHFSNREIRLAPSLRLPDVKDNLETRLLLLRRRLEEKGLPLRVLRLGGGRLALQSRGPLLVRKV